ncbi:class I glutamine amidotransferase-like protein [Phaeosphaeria sp. MPI-PUGE-AT-0046c]|nr:class I glutamine amidotransferase-like protein [Phaeosphaeria sp. MPI-PUGE-AT-0046c]
MPSTIRICMLNADIPVPSLLPRYPTWGRIFHSLLATAAPNITITSTDFDVTNDEYPSCMSNFDAIVLSGSENAAYDDVPWVKRLDAFIAGVYAEQPHVKIFATCFGHQLVCQSLLGKYGVRAELDPNGSEIGVKEITFNEKFLSTFGAQDRREDVLLKDDLSGRMRLQLVHGDHVVVPAGAELPQEWELVGTTEHCAMQGAYLPGRVFTLQGHFEFNREINSEVIKHEFGSSWAPERLQGVLDDIDADDDADVAARMLCAFFLEKAN